MWLRYELQNVIFAATKALYEMKLQLIPRLKSEWSVSNQGGYGISQEICIIIILRRPNVLEVIYKFVIRMYLVRKSIYSSERAPKIRQENLGSVFSGKYKYVLKCLIFEILQYLNPVFTKTNLDTRKIQETKKVNFKFSSKKIWKWKKGNVLYLFVNNIREAVL